MAYLVGGSVRDLLLNNKPKDFDISTNATPHQIKSLFRRAIIIGRRFRLVHVRFGKKIIEVATFRAECSHDSIILHDNTFGSEKEDAERRDFTINGLFYNSSTDTIIDYVGGYLDIEKKILRVIGNPERSFLQDPVRMIRLLKFRSRFGLQIQPETLQALHACKNNIMKSSHARIFEEILRMLESGASTQFLKNITNAGFTKLLLPAIHHFKNKEKIYKIFDQIDKVNYAMSSSCFNKCATIPHNRGKVIKNKTTRPLLFHNEHNT